MFTDILIIADIEGSSGCWDYAGSSFLTRQWATACREMSLDVNALTTALFDAGARRVRIKDFHRTGFNIFPELVDRRAALISGYHRGPIPGIGSAAGAQAVFFIGLHAASGTDGFLSHTLTSRLSALTVNGRPMAEIELFAAALARHGIAPVFFSGCPEACRQAVVVVPGIGTHPIDKSGGPGSLDSRAWRRELRQRGAAALHLSHLKPYRRRGPFDVDITFRDGEGAAAVSRRWQLPHRGARITFSAADMATLYMMLIRICYLTPAVERLLPLGLPLFNLRGRLGRAWARDTAGHRRGDTI
ncbi:MAG: M55 family metallopeptidase [Pseudomonadota bacterium]